MRQKCLVVYDAEVDGVIFVAAFVWSGTLRKFYQCPSGSAHSFKWRMGGQHVQVYSGYAQGATRLDKKDLLAEVLAGWRRPRLPSSPP